jgi:hypothetical protein
VLIKIQPIDAINTIIKLKRLRRLKLSIPIYDGSEVPLLYTSPGKYRIDVDKCRDNIISQFQNHFAIHPYSLLEQVQVLFWVSSHTKQLSFTLDRLYSTSEVSTSYSVNLVEHEEINYTPPRKMEFVSIMEPYGIDIFG